MTSLDFENHNFNDFNALNLSFKNVITVGRLKCCVMEDRKMWHGREKCRKMKWESSVSKVNLFTLLLLKNAKRKLQNGQPPSSKCIMHNVSMHLHFSFEKDRTLSKFLNFLKVST